MSRDGVLLLGGAGFIGNALARRLARDGVPVHVIGRDQSDRVESVLPLCSTVIHLASATTPGSSATQPDLELDNLALTLRLLELLKRQPQTHLVFFSSGGTVYGNPHRLPVTEDSPIAPLSNHGAGKASSEVFCQAFRARGHAVTILRPSNAYGPGQGLKSGFGLVRTMLEHARAGTLLEIWGDGENVRDFIHIDDVVEATTRLVRLPQDSGTYNLGSGIGFSINQVRRIVEAAIGAELPALHRPARGIDVRSLVLDTSRLQARLDWRPGIGLAEGVKGTWEWLRLT
ncbi:MAG TPA: NAD-dependent epimerase/dehydratase family protein [Ramlibacter sp.]|uniref:NAD-dependent epimerase/dehydratase family protein n=1 Tax=Ramlibacter sp. TaxID=1917967 RepID=UPI002ED4F695